ncbi:MAG: hypothetical protein JWO03_1128 [Bacteroidetes bacterium]|nr:hypothetical protein [Bacteroidota bacterium]
MNLYKTYSFCLLILVAMTLVAISGCSHPDACASEFCLNGGSCADGRCSCPPNFIGEHCDSCKNGYEGSDCSTLSRIKFLYSGYHVSETDDHGGSGNYNSSVLVSTNQIDQVYLLHVAGSNFTNTVAATCKGSVITIPIQKPDVGQLYIHGSGSISGGTIHLSCQIGDSLGASLATFTSTWTR